MWQVPDRVEMGRHTRLGDTLSVLTGLDNYCRLHRNGRKMEVCTPLGPQLAELFGFPNLVCLEQAAGGESLDGQFGACSWREDWPSRFYNKLCRDSGLTPLQVRMPDSKLGAWRGGSAVYAQLDTRSGSPLTAAEMKRFVALASMRRRITVLGGPDTGKYLGDCYEYSLGNVGHLARMLLECHHMIGVDSGVAHLAGYLGAPACITNCCGFEAVYAFFGEYKGFRFIDRSFLTQEIK